MRINDPGPKNVTFFIYNFTLLISVFKLELLTISHFMTAYNAIVIV